MSASATSANAGLYVEWRASIPAQDPLRPSLQNREESAVSQIVVEAKHVLITVLITVIFHLLSSTVTP